VVPLAVVEAGEAGAGGLEVHGHIVGGLVDLALDGLNRLRLLTRSIGTPSDMIPPLPAMRSRAIRRQVQVSCLPPKAS
jgi:hypothetical protein